MGKKALYPGSFDPVTYGHLDIIKRACKIFDQVVVGVAHNTQKKTLFSHKERMDMIKEVTTGMGNIEVVEFKGLVVEFARKNGIKVLVRGLRMISDFEYELQMALTNRRLDEKLETIFLMPSEGYSFLSSTLIKEAASLGADMSSFVPAGIEQRLKAKLK